MAGTLVPVRFKRAWRSYGVGDTITPTGVLRDWLVQNGYAECVEAEKPARPAKMGAKALAKVKEGARALFS